MTDYESLARALETSPDYRVLRRLAEKTVFTPYHSGALRTAIVLDTETTGSNSDDEIIELAMIKFRYDENRNVIDVIDTFSQLREPSKPIGDANTAIHGITNEMVVGATISEQDIDAFVHDADVIIAHYAQFDRPMCEKLSKSFEAKPWACSYDKIPWTLHGYQGSKLGNLLAANGFFHEGHRALSDCQALLQVLALPFGATEQTALNVVLTQAHQRTARIWCLNAPYDAKDLLKKRGYFWPFEWPDPRTGPHRAWWRDVPQDALDEELAYLSSDVFKKPTLTLPTARITARERYSLNPVRRPAITMTTPAA